MQDNKQFVDTIFSKLTTTKSFKNLEKAFRNNLTSSTITNERIYQSIKTDSEYTSRDYAQLMEETSSNTKDSLIEKIEEEIDDSISYYLQFYFDQLSVQQYILVCHISFFLFLIPIFRCFFFFFFTQQPFYSSQQEHLGTSILNTVPSVSPQTSSSIEYTDSQYLQGLPNLSPEHITAANQSHLPTPRIPPQATPSDTISHTDIDESELLDELEKAFSRDIFSSTTHHNSPQTTSHINTSSSVPSDHFSSAYSSSSSSSSSVPRLLHHYPEPS